MLAALAGLRNDVSPSSVIQWITQVAKHLAEELTKPLGDGWSYMG